MPALQNLEVQRRLRDLGTLGTKLNNGGGYGFEWNTVFAYKQSGILKIPKMAMPTEGGISTFAMGGRGYESEDVYNPLEEILAGRSPASSVMGKSTPFDCTAGEREAVYEITKSDSVSVGKFKTEKGPNGCVWSMAPADKSGVWPQYIRASDMSPVAESEVPAGLREQKFPKQGTTWGVMKPYDAQSNKPQGGCLDSPGPADPKMYCTLSSVPTWIGYKWYRFVDHPGLQRLRLTSLQKKFMQGRVEHLHQQLSGKDRWIRGGPSVLAEVSGAQLVVPPKGLEYGYVPIVVYEGVKKPANGA